MPSLRRTVSSPAVRPSPYPTTLSVGISSSAVGANRPRRTNSETAGRRVLADIDWWRVLDGQHAEDLDADRDQEQSPRVVQDETDASVLSTEQDQLPFAGVDIVRPMSPAPHRVELSSEPSSLMMPFATMSISAIAPSTPPRSRRAQNMSTSSTESTPEPSSLRDAYLGPLEGLECDPATHPLVLHEGRSLSFVDFPTPRSPTDNRFGDIMFL
ncbi:hypothetical protein BD410DRAFT_418611 [Rickenella mellea]|uniref:Uncharacterized protein n=1 Tax=Rickenella mellea TaxID=50990 RepID=A0A4Y7QJK6_9AGAM|nr:hypothetical protein BD410DRAFT_418611 [Rickenella mellea]